MANFSININEQILAPYSRDITTTNYSECDVPILETYAITLLENVGTPGQLHFLNTYTGDLLKTLSIENLEYSNPLLNASLIYNSVTLIEGSNTDIDITGLTTVDIIPLLEIEYSISTAAVDYIKFDCSITDINDVKFPSVNVQLYFNTETCFVIAGPSFYGLTEIVANTICTNGQTKAFGIQAAAYSTVTLRYVTTDAGNSGLDGEIWETDTYDGTNKDFKSNFVGSTGYTRDIIINMGSDTIKYFRACVEARAPLEGDPNDVTVTLSLRNYSNTGTIGSIVLTDTQV